MRQAERVGVLERLKASLVPGRVYRRADLAALSSNVDRHLAQMVGEGSLKKIAQGMYAVPRNTAFGEAPPEAESLVRAFLKDDHFVIYGLSQFNALGLGTTQLYNQLIVFNRKRVGEFSFGNRVYTFYRWREAPKRLTPEFLAVELLNRLDELAEDREHVLARLKEKLKELDGRRLRISASRYGTLSAQKKLAVLMAA